MSKFTTRNNYLMSLLLAYYIVYVLVFFKTRLSIHHPLEVLLQNRSIGSFISHPISTGRYESKVCPLGKVVAWIFAAWLILRVSLTSKISIGWSRRFWTLFLLGATLMNPNVLVYIFPAFILDYLYNFCSI
jgi:hypothetical protein